MELFFYGVLDIKKQWLSVDNETIIDWLEKNKPHKWSVTALDQNSC